MSDNPISSKPYIFTLRQGYDTTTEAKHKGEIEDLQQPDSKVNFRITLNKVTKECKITKYEKSLIGDLQRLVDRIVDFFKGVRLITPELALHKLLSSNYQRRISQPNQLLMGSVNGKVSQAATPLTISLQLTRLCEMRDKIREASPNDQLIKDALEVSSKIADHENLLSDQDKAAFEKLKQVLIPKATIFVKNAFQEATEKAKDLSPTSKDDIAAFVDQQKRCMQREHLKSITGNDYPQELFEQDKEILPALLEKCEEMQNVLSSPDGPVLSPTLAFNFNLCRTFLRELDADLEKMTYTTAEEGLKQAMDHATTAEELLTAYESAYKAYDTPSKYGTIPFNLGNTLNEAASRIYTKQHLSVNTELEKDSKNARMQLLKPYAEGMKTVEEASTAALQGRSTHSDMKIAVTNPANALNLRAQNKTYLLLGLTRDIMAYGRTIANSPGDNAQQHKAYGNVKHKVAEYFSDFAKDNKARLPDWAKRTDAKRTDAEKETDRSTEQEVLQKVKAELEAQIDSPGTSKSDKKVFREAIKNLEPMINHGINGAIDDIPKRYTEMLKAQTNNHSGIPVPPDQISANLNKTFIP